MQPLRSTLLAMRAWRTWLLAVVALVQGAQYVANPQYPLHSQSYAALATWGPSGWKAFGACLMAVGGWLAVVAGDLEVLGHLVGTVLYGVLAVATMRSGFVPAVLVLPLGLHAGEVAVWIWGQLRPWWRSRNGRSERGGV